LDNNISDVLGKEIEKLMKNKFFFRMPSNSKILAYSASYLLLILIGLLLNIEIVAAFLSVFPLTYVLGAKGLRYYIPLILGGAGILLAIASPIMTVWFAIHMLIAYIIYKTIFLRASKLFLVVALVLESFSNLQKSFPVTLFIMLFVYSLILVQYTLSLLAREYVIIPAFPKFSRIMLSQKSAYIYIVVTIVALLVEIETGSNTYSFWNILFQNITGVLSLAFILNGLFTAFFFIEQKMKSNIGKPVVFVLMLIFSPIFELLGFIDSVFKLREGYIIMKRGR